MFFNTIQGRTVYMHQENSMYFEACVQICSCRHFSTCTRKRAHVDVHISTYIRTYGCIPNNNVCIFTYVYIYYMYTKYCLVFSRIFPSMWCVYTSIYLRYCMQIHMIYPFTEAVILERCARSVFLAALTALGEATELAVLIARRASTTGFALALCRVGLHGVMVPFSFSFSHSAATFCCRLLFGKLRKRWAYTRWNWLYASKAG